MCNASLNQEKFQITCKTQSRDHCSRSPMTPPCTDQFLILVSSRKLSRGLLISDYWNMSTAIIYCQQYSQRTAKKLSTETPVVCVLNAIFGAFNQGHVRLLVLLDLSAAAFNTVDRTILMDVEWSGFRIFDRLLQRLLNFLSDQSQIVQFNSSYSEVTFTSCEDLYLVQRDSSSIYRMFQPVLCITDFASTRPPTTCRAYIMTSQLRPG